MNECPNQLQEVMREKSRTTTLEIVVLFGEGNLRNVFSL